MVETITIFVLAIFVGYYVVWGVAHATYGGNQRIVIDYCCWCDVANCGLPVLGVDANVAFQSVNVVSVLGAIAVFLASINIFGGFAVTAHVGNVQA